MQTVTETGTGTGTGIAIEEIGIGTVTGIAKETVGAVAIGTAGVTMSHRGRGTMTATITMILAASGGTKHTGFSLINKGLLVSFFGSPVYSSPPFVKGKVGSIHRAPALRTHTGIRNQATNCPCDDPYRLRIELLRLITTSFDDCTSFITQAGSLDTSIFMSRTLFSPIFVYVDIFAPFIACFSKFIFDCMGVSMYYLLFAGKARSFVFIQRALR